MNNRIKIVGALMVVIFVIWFGYSTNSLQEGIIGAISLLNCFLLINLSYKGTQKIA